MKSIIGFLAFVLLVIAFMFSISGKKYPRIPADEKHKAVKEVSACMDCHGAGKEFAMKLSHPPKYECFKCHKTKRTISK